MQDLNVLGIMNPSERLLRIHPDRSIRVSQIIHCSNGNVKLHNRGLQILIMRGCVKVEVSAGNNFQKYKAKITSTKI
ncbi:hypothetical protein ACB092_11G045500 [Castanea dentata]